MEGAKAVERVDVPTMSSMTADAISGVALSLLDPIRRSSSGSLGMTGYEYEQVRTRLVDLLDLSPTTLFSLSTTPTTSGWVLID